MTDLKDLTPEEMAHWRENLPQTGTCDEDIFEQQVLVTTALLERAVAQLERLQSHGCESCRHWVPMDTFKQSPWCSLRESRFERTECCTAYEPEETAHD